jgi:hypothetical protein
VLHRAILALIAVLALWSLTVAVTAGFDLRPYGVPFKSTDPDRPAAAALALAAAYALAFRDDTRRHLAWVDVRARPLLHDVERRAPYIALAVALAIAFLGVKYGQPVAGGSDSYGYVSQADLFLARDLITEQPIATQVPWPDADATFAPLGYRPAAEVRGAIVPTYSAGLSVLMAIGKAIAGACGPYLVVPLLGGLMVWMTYWLGAMLWSPLLGLGAALLMATSPAFLFMLMNPMSDVAVSAVFTAALVTALSPWRTRAFWTGVLVSIAIFIRPNLVPLGAVYLGWLVLRAPGWNDRWRAALWFSAGGLPLILVIAALNNHLYGAPWNSGYGSLDQYYSWSYWIQNLVHYSRWLFETETAIVLLAAVPLVMVRRIEPGLRAALALLMVFAAAVWLAYLFYTPFDAWWYLRFLLPAFPAMFVLALIGGVLLVTRVVRVPSVATLGIVIAVIVFALRVNDVRDRALLTLYRGAIVYASAADYVRTRLPDNAVIITVQHSGSIRYHAKRLTMRWDQLAPAWWPRALDVLAERGYRPYLLISFFEEAQLRRQFGFSEAEDGPGTLVAVMTDPDQIRIYDPLRESTGPPATIPIVIPCPCGVSPEPR